MAIVAGRSVTAAQLRAGMGGEWFTYSPTWTGSGSAPSLGNGSLYGRWTKVGSTVLCRGSWIAGTTTAYGSGVFRFSLPEAAKATPGGFLPPVAWAGTAYGRDVSGTAQLHGAAVVANAGSYLEIASHNSLRWSNSTPMTWAVGDSITWFLMYEATPAF